MSGPSVTFPASGYYHFLGKGDMHPGHPMSLWDLPQWIAWMDRLKSLGHTCLWLLVNGHTLAYPSAAYPELKDHDARCAKEPGLVAAIVKAGHDRGFTMLAVVTTDGHALEFARRHPDLVSVDRAGKPVGDDTLCLEEPEVEAYLQRVFEEAADLAPWDGVVFHPTEATPLRFNAATRHFYHDETGRELDVDPDDTLLPWFNRRYASALARWMAWWRTRFPKCETVMFNCWWTDDQVAVYHDVLPESARICVWDYDYKNPDMEHRPLNAWVKAFGPDRIAFMPSSGGYPESGRPPGDEALAGYDRLLALAAKLKIRQVVYFAGWGAGSEADVKMDRALLNR